MTNTPTQFISFSERTADLAARALRGYEIAESDLIDAGSEVLQAAGPALVIGVLIPMRDHWQHKIAASDRGSIEWTVYTAKWRSLQDVIDQMLGLMV